MENNEGTIFMKQLIANGSGEYQVIEVKAASRDIYLADDWQDSSKEEFVAQFKNRTAEVESEADKALGESEDETQAENEVKAVGTEDNAQADQETETKPDNEA